MYSVLGYFNVNEEGSIYLGKGTKDVFQRLCNTVSLSMRLSFVRKEGDAYGSILFYGDPSAQHEWVCSYITERPFLVGTVVLRQPPGPVAHRSVEQPVRGNASRLLTSRSVAGNGWFGDDRAPLHQARHGPYWTDQSRRDDGTRRCMGQAQWNPPFGSFRRMRRGVAHMVGARSDGAQ
ncbi:unnamed protein product [Parajaminaea phylloscopi]